MLAECKVMLTDPFGWLYIWGGSGNAKSIALRAMCNHLSLKGYTPTVYIKFSRLAQLMRDAYSERTSRQQQFQKGVSPDAITNLGYLDRFERLLQIKVLAIEEFDKARVTDFANEFRFDFLDDRYEQALQGETITLFAANSNPLELPQPLRSRIEDGRFRVVENTAGDARPDAQRGDI